MTDAEKDIGRTYCRTLGMVSLARMAGAYVAECDGGGLKSDELGYAILEAMTIAHDGVCEMMTAIEELQKARKGQ